ncbi:MAG: site-specific integrase [SAR324 cluster bacterium]|nr:site-specific integrase [SAR324 cluster bacterium]
MATVTERLRKNGKKIFRVEIRIKGNPPLSKSFERKADATDWARQQEVKIKQGCLLSLDADRQTIALIISNYLEDIVSKMCLSSRSSYSNQLYWFRDRVGQFTLRQLIPALIVQQRKILQNEDSTRGKRSAATCNRYLAELSSCCSYAVEQQILEENPCRKIKKLTEPRGRTRFLGDQEHEKLIAACKDNSPQLHLAVVLSLATGARRDEIWSLRWENVDMAEGYLTFHETKDGDIRSVPVIGQALDLLREYHRKHRLLHTSLLFPSSTNPQKPLEFRKRWESVLRKSEIVNFRYHDLRHSAASYMVRNGMDLRLVAEILGHRTPQMTMRYSHLKRGHLKQAMLGAMGA